MEWWYDEFRAFLNECRLIAWIFPISLYSLILNLYHMKHLCFCFDFIIYSWNCISWLAAQCVLYFNSFRPYICVGNLTTIGSGNGLSPGRYQAIIWTNTGTFLIGRLETNFSQILIEITTVSFLKNAFENIVCKMTTIFFLGLNRFKSYTSHCLTYHIVIL